MSDLSPFLGSRAQQGFMGTVLLQAVIVLTMVAITFGLVEGNVSTTSRDQFRTLPCYFALFALAQIFHLVLSYDALRLRNIVQIVGLLMFQVALIIYSGLQIVQTRSALVLTPGADCSQFYVTCSGPGSLWSLIEPFQIVVPIICGVSWILLTYFAWKLFGEFGWDVFRIVGADPRLKSMFRYYQIVIVLLKFDYFAFTGLTMQLLILVLTEDTAQFGLTIAAIPIVLILLTACGIAVVREIKILMAFSFILMLAAEAYFLYKFSRLFAPVTRHQYDTTRKTLGVFIIFAFLMLLATFCVGIKCYLDFDKGLKPVKIREPTSLPRLSHLRKNSQRDSKLGPSTPTTPGMVERGNSYGAGEPLRPQISIE